MTEAEVLLQVDEADTDQDMGLSEGENQTETDSAVVSIQSSEGFDNGEFPQRLKPPTLIWKS